jgi:hypothetical protein
MRAGVVIRDAGAPTMRPRGRVFEQIEVRFDRALIVAGVDVYAAGRTMTLFVLEQLLGPGGDSHVLG